MEDEMETTELWVEWDDYQDFFGLPGVVGVEPIGGDDPGVYVVVESGTVGEVESAIRRITGLVPLCTEGLG